MQDPPDKYECHHINMWTVAYLTILVVPVISGAVEGNGQRACSQQEDCSYQVDKNLLDMRIRVC